MEETTYKQNSCRYTAGETALVANSKETIVGIPIIAPPIEVEVTLRIVPVEVRHVAVTIDLANRASCKKLSTPLLPDNFAEAESNS